MREYAGIEVVCGEVSTVLTIGQWQNHLAQGHRWLDCAAIRICARWWTNLGEVALMDGNRVIAQDTIAALARDLATRGRFYDHEVVSQVAAHAAAALDPGVSRPTMPPC
jgi:hypothetical protein